MPFQIAIPSYKRPQVLVKKTLRMLSSAQVPQDIITIFVASQEEAAMYILPGYKIVVGRPGINHQRRFIEEYYPVGTWLVCIDDDVSQVKMLHKMPLAAAVERMFEIAVEEGCFMWGVSASSHTLSMKDEYVVGLRYIIGAFHGLIIREPIELSPSPFYEDFWRTCQTYRRDGKVVRFNGLAPVTRYFAEPGGLQDFRTQDTQHLAMVEFKSMFPTLCRLRVREGRHTDVIIKSFVQKRVLRPLEGS